MADCNETIQELYTFLDDELPTEVRTHVDSHLNGCMDCLQAFDFHAELKAAVRRKCATDELPEGLLDRLARCFDNPPE